MSASSAACAVRCRGCRSRRSRAGDDEEREDERVRFGEVECALDVILGRRRIAEHVACEGVEHQRLDDREVANDAAPFPRARARALRSPPRASRSARWIAASAGTRLGVLALGAPTRSPARPEPPATSPMPQRASAPGAHEPDRQWVGRHHQRIWSRCTVDERRDGLREPSLAETLDPAQVAHEHLLGGLGVRVGAPAPRDPATAAPSSNRPCHDIDLAHRREHHAGRSARTSTRTSPRSPASRCASSPLGRQGMPSGRRGEMAEAAHLRRRAARSAARAPGPLRGVARRRRRRRPRARRCRGS